MKERRKSHTRMIGFLNHLKKGVAQVERVLNEPVPSRGPQSAGERSAAPAMRGGGRVIYVARVKTAKVAARAQQMLDAINRKGGRATAPEVMAAMSVNRNVIAGAVHELKQAGAVVIQPALPQVAAAAEYAPRTKRKYTKRKKRTTRK